MLVPYTFTNEAWALVLGDELDPSPTRAHGEEDAAYDLYAVHNATIHGGNPNTEYIRTGVRVAIPEGCAGLVLPRSGLANKEGLMIPNSPGLIDPGYRGEIVVGLRKPLTLLDVENMKHRGTVTHYDVIAGSRIAQLLIVGPKAPYKLGFWFPKNFESFCVTQRGEGGFGSSGE